jgi:poly(3-hydroxyoctanoate) depolymerase
MAHPVRMRFSLLVVLLVACGPQLPLVAEGEGEGEGEGNEGEGDGAAEGEGEGEEGERRCMSTDDDIRCSYETTVFEMGLLNGGDRDVHFQVPIGPTPAAGWPVVVFFQGSLFSAELSFSGSRGDAFGRLSLAQTFGSLLDAGFAVIAPETLGEGATAWQTNVPPTSLLWEGSNDDQFILALLATMTDVDGPFGALQVDRFYAMGISSGGFMTSRMAVSYPGRFAALAIHSAGYATCGAVCLLPSLPGDHPPTLFLHGNNDVVVTRLVMEPYRDELQDMGITVSTIIDDDAGHEWLADAVTAIPAWFAQ